MQCDEQHVAGNKQHVALVYKRGLIRIEAKHSGNSMIIDNVLNDNVLITITKQSRRKGCGRQLPPPKLRVCLPTNLFGFFLLHLQLTYPEFRKCGYKQKCTFA